MFNSTGLWVPHVPDYPGIENIEVNYYLVLMVSFFHCLQGYESVSIDPDDFINKVVLILGRGKNSYCKYTSTFHVCQVMLLSKQLLTLLVQLHIYTWPAGTMNVIVNLIYDTYRSRIKMAYQTHYVGDLRYEIM